jgi:hypothetical protein
MGDNEWLKVVQRSIRVKDNFLNTIANNRRAKLFDPTPISGHFNFKLTNILVSIVNIFFLTFFHREYSRKTNHRC